MQRARLSATLPMVLIIEAPFYEGKAAYLKKEPGGKKPAEPFGFAAKKEGE